MKSNFDKVFYETLGNYFMLIRKEKKLTLAEVSKKLGISTMALECYEHGKRNCPISIYRQLCLLYGVDYNEAFDSINALTDFNLINKQNV